MHSTHYLCHAGPSGPLNPSSSTSFTEPIIILSDSEGDASFAEVLPRKRRRLSNTIDLTDVDSLPSIPSNEIAPLSFLDSTALSTVVQDPSNKMGINEFAKNHDGSTGLAIGQNEGSKMRQTPETTSNSTDDYLSRILEVVPDVVPEYVHNLINQSAKCPGLDVVTTIVHVLLEQPYPKVDRKGKRKREDNESSVKEDDYSDPSRPFTAGTVYKQAAMEQLKSDFPFVPIPYIRTIWETNNFLYAPTHLVLRRQLQEQVSPSRFKLKTTRSKANNKGKWHDVDLGKEIAWLSEYLQREKPLVANPQRADNGECEDGIECGCCFSTYIFDKMVQCPDAHLFCVSCMTSYVENKLGRHDPKINCVDQNGCKLAFSDSELERFLPSKLINLYYRVKQAKDIEEAEIDGLEECPFCEYKVVIENREEKLFRCERDDCGAVSCRTCKKLDHLPQSCKEVEENRDLGALHKIEEAMSDALMRNCPKCKKAFIKEGGCNKMTCPNCTTKSCYICRRIVQDYTHFEQGKKHHPGLPKRCLLWDPVERRHDEEVEAARDKAVKEVQIQNPQVDIQRLDIHRPKPREPDVPITAQNNINHFQLPNYNAADAGVQHMGLHMAGLLNFPFNIPVVPQGMLAGNLLPFPGHILPLDRPNLFNGRPPTFQIPPLRLPANQGLPRLDNLTNGIPPFRAVQQRGLPLVNLPLNLRPNNRGVGPPSNPQAFHRQS